MENGDKRMYILQLEDDIYKQYHIQKVLEDAYFPDFKLEHVTNLHDGIDHIERQINVGKQYDLIITDMWYPEKNNGTETDSGNRLIELVRDNKWNIPIIVCSSVDYEIPGILGTVHYAENEDWEKNIVQLIRQSFYKSR